jgi:hypothetical protein
MNLQYLTKQEIFDIAYTGLKNQYFQRSVVYRAVSGNECKYRGENGLKCSIGHAIPDDLYQESFEGRQAKMLILNNETMFNSKYSEFLGELQWAHDYGYDDSMDQKLKSLAKKYKLTIPK